LLCAHGRVGQTQLHIFLRRILQSEIRNSAAAESEGGQKFLPPQPLSFLPARTSGFVPAARSAAINLGSVQKRFERRSVIATNQNLTIFQDERVARSPRLRRVSLRKKPVVSGLNQTAGEARRGLVLKAGGGSELRSNSQMKFVSNFFLSAFGGIRSQFLIPRFTAKGD